MTTTICKRVSGVTPADLFIRHRTTAITASRSTTASVRLQGEDGVTLLEILVAIVIMGIGLVSVSTLFPLGLLSIRQAFHEDRAARSLARLAVATLAFTSHQGVDPRSLKDLTPLLDGDDRYADGEEGGYLFGLDGGDQLTAVPAAPGKTGVRHFCAAAAEVYDCTRPEDVRLARASQQRMRLHLLLSAGAAAAEMLQAVLADGARTPIRPWPSPVTIRERAFDLVDADRNGAVTVRELLRLASSDTPVGRFFETFHIQAELGAGDEDIDRLPGASKAAIMAQTASLWGVPALRDLTALLVSDSATVQDLEPLLRAAELAGASGDLVARTASLEAYIDHVERAAGKTVSQMHASVLATLARLSADWR